jgi:hypothetical protein
MKKTMANMLKSTPTPSQRVWGKPFIQTSPGNSGMSLGAVKEFVKRYRVSQETVTRMTGFSLRAITNWNQGSRPSASTARRLIEVKRLFAALENLVSPEAIGPWLKEPNPAFDGSTPLQVIERGESDRIWRMVYELESGEPS